MSELQRSGGLDDTEAVFDRINGKIADGINVIRRGAEARAADGLPLALTAAAV